MTSVPWEEAHVRGFDAALIVTAHACVDYRQLLDWSELVIDTRNATAGLQGRARVVKA